MANFCILRMKKLHANSNVASSIEHHLRIRRTDNADPEKMRYDRFPGFDYSGEALVDITVRKKMKNVVMAKYRRNLPEKVRKNAVRAVEFMMTVSPEVMSRKDFSSAGYLYDCEAWARRKFGKENVFFVAEHYDETTPHVSILINPKDETGKLNARKFFGGREKLSALQDSFYEEVGKAYRLDRGIKGSKAKHQTIKQYYARLNEHARTVEELEGVRSIAHELSQENGSLRAYRSMVTEKTVIKSTDGKDIICNAGLLEGMRTAVQRISDLCDRWNSFTNDPRALREQAKKVEQEQIRTRG